MPSHFNTVYNMRDRLLDFSYVRTDYEPAYNPAGIRGHGFSCETRGAEVEEPDT